MLNPFICGSFHNQDQDEDNNLHSPCSTPRKSRKGSSKDSKNPYSTLGLDKFSELLADLEKKRQKIYSQVDPQDISFVRFAYSSSNDCVPIIVKLKDQNRKSSDKDERKDNPPVEKTTENQETKQPPRLELEKQKTKKKSTWNVLKLHKWRRPSYYMPIFIILILLFLAFFGRSVAILCTSIGWYLVPTLSSSSSKRPATKIHHNHSNNKNQKQLLRRFSELSPNKNNITIGEVKNNKSPHARQNSF